MTDSFLKLKELTENLNIRDKKIFENEQLLRTMVENIPGSVKIWTTDNELRVRCFTGHSKAEDDCSNNNKTIFDFIEKGKDDTLIKAHLDAVNGIASKFEYSLNNSYYLFSIKPLEDDFGNIIGTIGTQFNISKYISMKSKLNKLIELLKKCKEFNNLSCVEAENIKNLIYKE